MIPFKEIFTIIELRYILLDKLIKYYRILALITSDKDKLFILVY